MSSLNLPILHDLHDPQIIADPYPTYARMRREHPVWLNPASASFTVSRYADVERVFKGSEFSNSRVDELFSRVPPESRSAAEAMRPLLEPRLLFTEGERHARIKRLLAQAFSPAHLSAYECLIEARIAFLLDRLPTGQPVDFVGQVSNQLPGMVILSLLGLPLEEQDEMKDWTDNIYAWMGHFTGSIIQRTQQALDAMQGLRRRLREHIEDVRRTPRNDMLSAMVHARDAGLLLDEDELVANVIGLVNAGQETTACLLANGLLRLMQYPAQMERLRGHPELLDSAIEEMLRFDAPAQFVARRVVEPVTLQGLTLDAGAMVALGLASANRDESVFEHADVFDIGRTPNKHLAFGAGRHFCVGSGLARLEARALFRALLKGFSSIHPAWDSSAGLRWRPTLSFRCPLELPVVIQSGLPAASP